MTSPNPATAPEILDDAPEACLYELCMLYPSNLSQKDEQVLFKGMDEIFAEAEAKQIAKDQWGRRGLAYSINKQTEGNYVVLYIEIDPAKLREMDRQLRILPNMLRHMIVKPPKGYEIVKYSERFTQWLKEREVAVEKKQKDEESRLQRKVVEKAKREAKRTEAKKKEPSSTLEEADLSQKLDELISDDTLGL